MKILGIGNAIVDVICKVNDSFINQNNLTKSTMKLFFDENEFKNNFFVINSVCVKKKVKGRWTNPWYTRCCKQKF